MKLMQKRDNRGFTIVELLIVIVVIGILAALVIIQFTNIQARARDTERKSDMRSIQSKLAEYYALNGRYPTALSDSGLALPVDSCKAPSGTATDCSAPDYAYKAFLTATATPADTYAASNSATADGTGTDAGKYILYINNLETGSSTYYRVTSN
jgi:prepilin-type N-terminal cleavage/methylation domain-containing protein